MEEIDLELYHSIAHLERELGEAIQSVHACLAEKGARKLLEERVGRAVGFAAELQLALSRLGYDEDEEATRATARTMIHEAFDLAARYRKGLL
jgi:hypothetical protein